MNGELFGMAFKGLFCYCLAYLILVINFKNSTYLFHVIWEIILVLYFSFSFCNLINFIFQADG